MAAGDKQLLKVLPAAKILDVSPRRLRDAGWRRKYSCPAYKCGGQLRFSRTELLAWLEARHEGGSAA